MFSHYFRHLSCLLLLPWPLLSQLHSSLEAAVVATEVGVVMEDMAVEAAMEDMAVMAAQLKPSPRLLPKLPQKLPLRLLPSPAMVMAAMEVDMEATEEVTEDTLDMEAVMEDMVVVMEVMEDTDTTDKFSDNQPKMAYHFQLQ